MPNRYTPSGLVLYFQYVLGTVLPIVCVYILSYIALKLMLTSIDSHCRANKLTITTFFQVQLGACSFIVCKQHSSVV